MGLLDEFDTMPDDRKSAVRQGLLTMGLNMLAGGGNFAQQVGRGGLAGLGGYQDALERQKAEQSQKTLRQMQELQLNQAKRSDQRQQRLDALPGQFYQSTASQALAGGGGPTAANAQRMEGMTPQFDADGYGRALMGVDPQAGVAFQQSIAKQHPAPISVKPGETLFDPLTRRPIYSAAHGPMAVNEGQTVLDPLTRQPIYAAPKTEALPGAVREYQFAQGQGYPGTFDQWEFEKRKAGAPSVSVNTGQHGIENEFKLGDKFRSEPIYKAHQEVQSAHAQVTAALQQQNPVGDLAAATKIMKILDPGSVVRESELGMAMAATGMADRVQNYASNVINGTKLTPQQRVEFKQMADALLNESSKQFNAKRSEYEGMGNEWGLNPSRALGRRATEMVMPLPKPMPGMVRNGYKLKMGGDPTAQNSWEPVR